MNNPTITTIIPTYRRPQLLKRAIESVLQQTIKSSAVYVFDNASGDETKDVVEAYYKIDSRVRYFCHKENIGPAHNFARALDHLQTPYFSFLQDDDYLLPWFYETALNGFKAYPSAGFSACRTLIVNAQGKLIPSQFSLPVLSGFFSVPDSVSAVLKTPLAPALWNGVLFKKEVIQKVGGLDPTAGTATDFTFTVKCACAFPFVITSRPAAVLMVWPKSTTFSQSDSDSDNLAVVFENIEKYLQAPEEVKSNIFLRLNQLQILGKKRIWIRLLLAGREDAARSAKEAFLALGGKMSFLVLKILTWSETNKILRRMLTLLLFFRNQAYTLLAWLTSRKDPERKLYALWVKKTSSKLTLHAFSLSQENCSNQDIVDSVQNPKDRKPSPDDTKRMCAKHPG